MHSLKYNVLKCGVKIANVKGLFKLKEDELRAFAEEKRKGKVLLPSKKMCKKFAITSRKVGGNTCYKIASLEKKSKKKVLYIHGGGYILEADSLEWGMAYDIVKETKATVYFPRYPLAPEHNCLETFDMLNEIYTNIVKSTEAENVTIIGDSAGGGIALSLAMEIKKRGLPQPANIILISPVMELSSKAVGKEDHIEYLEKQDPMISLEGLDIICDWWRGDLDKSDYRVSPRFGDIKDLAPITIFSSKDEVLNVFVKLFMQDAKKQGIEVELHEKKEMIHCWVLSPFKEAMEERERVMELIRGW